MLKSLKNLFRPESSVVKKQVSTLGVVFNSVNHTSLLAAVFTAIILEQKAKIKVFLIDVRDAFQEADTAPHVKAIVPGFRLSNRRFFLDGGLVRHRSRQMKPFLDGPVILSKKTTA